MVHDCEYTPVYSSGDRGIQRKWGMLTRGVAKEMEMKIMSVRMYVVRINFRYRMVQR